MGAQGVAVRMREGGEKGSVLGLVVWGVMELVLVSVLGQVGGSASAAGRFPGAFGVFVRFCRRGSGRGQFKDMYVFDCATFVSWLAT